MSFVRRALLALPALAACYAYAPPRWAAAEQPEESTGGPPTLEVPDGARGRIVEAARSLLGHSFSGDCSTFVRWAMREAEVDLGPLRPARSMSESLHLASREVQRPEPGDMVFFHDTYDRNRDGKLGDRWTHVSVVEAVDGDRIWILHRGGKGIVRLRMDLTRPTDESANDPVRARSRRDPPGTRYLTAELFAGYGSVVE